ncbi:gamma-glutamyl-gamma-aminobutyrate hydrolase family protein [Streptomyces caniferus]|uniref:type 1 glutamine amidotransferase n=1 Tax=Streptomyces caniferus TaxID=285557 RepID=UPI002E2E0CDA|nr:gamma-glutamyl-gamma-aminobutyrate hydrolase family protein [Streptomyces caniferus]
MRALVIVHDHLSTAGHIGERLAERGFELDELLVVPAERYTTPDVEVAFPAAENYDLILTLGAPWSVARRNAWIEAELALLRSAHEAGIPVLGICFGGQALATALGGGIEVAPRFELGWSRLTTDAPDLVGAGPWFQFHGDRWLLPPGAREVARNEFASQAFVCGRSWGVQFHPELTPEVLQAWFDEDGTAIAAEVGVDPERLVAELRADLPAVRERARVLVDAFLDQVMDRAPEEGPNDGTQSHMSA